MEQTKLFPPRERRQWFRRPEILFALILLLAFALRLYKSGAYGPYLDEKYTLVISQGIVMEGANQREVFFTPGKAYFTPQEFWKEKTFADFIEANIRNDIGNSPVYYAVLWTWIKLFGIGDGSIRFPSVLFSTLLVALVYVFVRRHFRSEPLALLSSLLAAVEPFFIAYSHMARNYSMSFFLTLLATHLFLLILERNRAGKPATGLYLGYGLTFILAILSHYLTITVFLCHGLYFLLYIRQPKLWVRFAAIAAIGLGLVSLWFIYGGGKYTFQTLAYQAEIYRQAAQTNPTGKTYGLVLPATPQNVAERSAPIWADLFLVTNGLGQVRELGIRNLGMAFLLGLLALGLLHYSLRNKAASGRAAPGWQAGLYGLLLLAVLPLATVPQPQYVVMAASPSFIYLIIRYLRQRTEPEQRPLLVFVFLLATVPTLFLVLMSFRNGHTYGITQRYSGFSFPYTVLLVSMLLRELVRVPMGFRVAILAALLLQAGLVARRLNQVYRDSEPKYTYFAEPRQGNPHQLAARAIEAQYQPGDTVLYPSIRLQPADEIEKTYWPYSIQEAQLTNLYLPKDATYLQRMDTTQTDRIILVKGKSGERVTIFDFEGRKYRY